MSIARAYIDRPIPGRWNQRPEPYGTVADVQSSLAHHAEKLGINYADIVFAAPLWTASGNTVFNYGPNNIHLANSGCVWDSKGLYGAASAYADATVPSVDSYPLTVLTLVEAEASTDDVIYLNIGDTVGWGQKFYTRATNGRFKALFEGSLAEAAINGQWLDTNKPGRDWTLALVCAASNDHKFYQYSNYGQYLHTSSIDVGTIDLSIVSVGYSTGGILRSAFDAGWLKSGLIVKQALTADQIASIDDNPWRLWQRVPRPAYFNVAAGGVATVEVGDSSHAHTADPVNLTQHHVLSVSDSAHGHTADSISLNQHHTISVADASHNQAAGNISLIQHHVLLIPDATHGHDADNVSVTQHQVLSIDNAGHIQLADTVNLTRHHLLTVNDSGHAHTADSLNLVYTPPAGTLAIEGTIHGHTADDVQLTQHQVLSIPDSSHGHSADSPAITQHHGLAVADAFHGHAAEAVNLVFNPVTMQLFVQDATHLQSANHIELTQHHVLAIQDARHSHAAEAIMFSLPRGIVRAVFGNARIPTAKFSEPKKPNVIISELGG